MSVAQNPKTKLMEKIRSLPPDKISVLEDFIDFLLTRSEDRLLVYSATKICRSSLC